MTASIIRIAVLLLPSLACFLLELARDHSSRLRSAALFAGLWSFLSALAVNVLAVQSGWWTFTVAGASLYGVPVDLMAAIGFCAAATALVAGTKQHYMAVGAALNIGAIFLLYIPALGFAELHERAVFGLLLVVTSSVPWALLLAFWTARDTRIFWRSFLQALIWTALLLWMLPSAALLNMGGSWTILAERNPLLFIPMLVPAAMIANALYVFAKYGDGTGFPYDPPKRLVERGIYQYVSNPTQIAICLSMGWWGFLLKNSIVLACAPIALLLFIVFKDVCNGSSNLCGDDPEWRAYHARVPRWFPKIK